MRPGLKEVILKTSTLQCMTGPLKGDGLIDSEECQIRFLGVEDIRLQRVLNILDSSFIQAVNKFDIPKSYAVHPEKSNAPIRPI